MKKILKRLVHKRQVVPNFTPLPLTTAQTICVIGDIHGTLPPLQALLKTCAAQAPDAQLVFLGDYIDRGDQVPEVLALLKRLQDDAGAICLKGNHEDMMLRFLDDPARNGPIWLRHGGLQTLAGYGVSGVSLRHDAQSLTALRDQLRRVFSPEMEAWLRALPCHFLSGTLAAVHAGADPARPMSRQKPQHLLWGHKDFGTVPRSDGLWIIHGHTIVGTPTMAPGIISVDTGAYITGQLSAALIAGDSVTFLQS